MVSRKLKNTEGGNVRMFGEFSDQVLRRDVVLHTILNEAASSSTRQESQNQSFSRLQEYRIRSAALEEDELRVEPRAASCMRSTAGSHS